MKSFIPRSSAQLSLAVVCALLGALVAHASPAEVSPAANADAPLATAEAPAPGPELLEPPPPSVEAVTRAQKSRDWRIGRAIVLPVVGAVGSLGVISGLFVAFSASCGPTFASDFLSVCGVAMFGAMFAAYVTLVPAAVSGVGQLMKGRGQYGVALLGSLAGVLLSMATAAVGFPYFLWPAISSVVLAPLGAVIGYELSSFIQESAVLERVQPIVMPLRDGIAGGVRVALW